MNTAHRICSRIGRLISGETGLGLTELMVSLVVMTSVLAVTGAALTNDFLAIGDVQKQSESLDDLRVAMAQIERDIRSADCILDPDAETLSPATSATLDLTTYAGGNGRVSAAWAVNGAGELTRTVGSTSRIVATGMASAQFTHYRPDALAQNDARKSRVVVTITRNAGGRTSGQRVFTTTVTARNANVVPAAGVCAP